MFRSRSIEQRYIEYKKKLQNDFCQFCKEPTTQLLETTKFFRVFENLFKYEMWDQRSVKEHLMIVPIKHCDSISPFISEELIEYVELIAKYEEAGYNIYSRTQKNSLKSVVHQHTHLIKTDGIEKSFQIFFKKPYLNFTR